jgi:hypothetical protein
MFYLYNIPLLLMLNSVKFYLGKGYCFIDTRAACFLEWCMARFLESCTARFLDSCTARFKNRVQHVLRIVYGTILESCMACF